MLRIAVPADQDPLTYVLGQAGSPALSRARAEAFNAQYDNDSSLSPREREVARMTIAHLMGCNHCVRIRMGRDRPGFSADPIPEELYTHVLEYRSWPGYSERERLAAEFCERFATDHVTLADDDETWVRLHENFSDAEIADLCILAGTWDAGRRMFQVLRVAQSCHIGDEPVVPKMPEAMRAARSR